MTTYVVLSTVGGSLSFVHFELTGALAVVWSVAGTLAWTWAWALTAALALAEALTAALALGVTVGVALALALALALGGAVDGAGAWGWFWVWAMPGVCAGGWAYDVRSGKFTLWRFALVGLVLGILIGASVVEEPNWLLGGIWGCCSSALFALFLNRTTLGFGKN